MKNLIAINKQAYEAENYVLRGDPSNSYYVGVDRGRFNQLRQQHGDDFNLIIYGDVDDPSDFYVVPITIAGILFQPQYLRQADERPRWKTFVVDDQLTVTGCPARVDVANRYGNFGLIDDNPEELPEEDEDEDEDEDEEPIPATVTDTEILRLAKQRKGHRAFSRRVLANFNHRCCLSAVEERDLLIASHIVPWGKRVPTRLDEANGLCLFAPFDKLFDKGYFTLSDDLVVQITPIRDGMSPYLEELLLQIEGRAAAPPINKPIRAEYLTYHRREVFMDAPKVAAGEDPLP